MMEISFTNRVRNKEELHRVKEERHILHAIKKKANWIGYTLHRHHLLKHITEGKIKRMGRQIRRHKQLLNKLTEKGRHWNLKVEAILISHKKATCIKQKKIAKNEVSVW